MINAILDHFKMHYPLEYERITEYTYNGRFSVTAKLNDGKTVMYNDNGNLIRTLPSDKNRMTEEECRREFAFRLRDLLKDKNVSQLELSEMTGIPRPMINGYINGRITPSIYKADLIARALGCSLDEMRYL